VADDYTYLQINPHHPQQICYGHAKRLTVNGKILILIESCMTFYYVKRRLITKLSNSPYLLANSTDPIKLA
jgi:hypothetical protein